MLLESEIKLEGRPVNDATNVLQESKSQESQEMGILILM